MSCFYILPRFDPSMLANKDLTMVAFGSVSEHEAMGMLDLKAAVRRGFGEEVELEPGDTGLIKDAHGRWTLFRVGTLCRSEAARIGTQLNPKRESNGTDDSGSNS